MTAAIPVADVPNLDKILVGGSWADPAGRSTYAVVSPMSGETIAEVPDPSPADADAAVAAARRAFDEGPWPTMPLDERIAAVRRFCAEMDARGEAISRAWVTESGPTINLSEGFTGAGPVIWDSYIAAAEELAMVETNEVEGQRHEMIREPVGTVLGILTYNGAYIQVALKIIPALLMGNTVIIKSAIESQLTSRFVAEAAAAANLPEGVVSVLAAGAETSSHLVSHEGVDMVSYTGGTAVGSDIIARCAPRMARVIMELGGKSAGIFTEDADIEDAMSALVPGAVDFGGQLCTALTRFLVPKSRSAEMIEALTARVEQTVVGDPFDTATDMGPLAVERARDRAEAAVAGATAAGAKVATGGKRPEGYEGGWWYEPTLLTGVDNSMQVAQEEVFGPVYCVIEYADIDDAVAIANDSRFGLYGAIYSEDTELALDVARRVRTGMFGVNTDKPSLALPFGGVKQSGFGREVGAEGLLEFTNIKAIVVA